MASSEADEVKSIIVSLLTSSPFRCTVKHLCDDYRDIVGNDIPYRRLGYRSPVDYLRSLTMCCQVFGQGSSAEVAGLLTPNSAHISMMVARQKTSNVPSHKKRFLKGPPMIPLNVSVFPRPIEANLSKKEERLSKKEAESYNECEKDDDDDKNSSKSIKSTSQTQCQPENSLKVPIDIQNRLDRLMKKFHNGITCIELLLKYRQMFSVPLQYERYHFLSLMEMCSHLPRIFTYVKNEHSGDYTLFHRDYRNTSSHHNNESVKRIPFNTFKDKVFNGPSIDWALGPTLIPSDVVVLGHVIPRYFPENIKVGGVLDVTLGEIYNISNFYVYDSYGELSNLLEEMKSFFERQKNQYLIPELLLQEGLYCTVFYANEYRRCVIVDVLNNIIGHIRVLFIDYGSVGDIPSTEVWYLPKKFGNVSCQAIKATLSSIAAINEEETFNKFRSYRKGTLVAQIMKIDVKEKKLEIYLADVTDENNIFYVNDLLVEKGYATFVD